MIPRRRRADRSRIAELERWHARQDCAERGHTLPDGYTTPTPEDLVGARETHEVTSAGSTRHLELPEGVVEAPCAHCGADLLATANPCARGAPAQPCDDCGPRRRTCAPEDGEPCARTSR